ncbi:MAG: ATP-binding protein [Treponema sp.]|nr:ATP-binding protein [Treponema sp.]
MLRKFRIKTRLLISFFIVVFFTLTVGLTGYISLTSIANSAVRTIHNVTILNDIYDYNAYIDAGVYNMLYINDVTLTNYVVLTTREHTENFLSRLNDYITMQDQFSDVFTPGEMQDMVNLLELYEETYIPVLNEIFDLVEQARREEALALSINRREPISNTIIYFINVAFNKNLEQSEIMAARNNESAIFNSLLMLTLVLLSLIVSVIFALLVTRSIAIPLSGLGAVAEKVAGGELEVQFEQSENNDEISLLSLRLSEMLQNLKQVQKLKLEAVEAHYEKEKAEAASKSKSDFLANMSHEIRTPMNAITGMSELLLMKNLPEDARSDVQDIKHAAISLISIINDILDFSKIEAGKLEINPARYMLLSLVNDTVNIIRIRLMEKPVRFYTNIDSKIPNTLFGDEVRLRQIIINLLSNAAKFTEKGHVSMSITRLLPETGESRTDTHILLKIEISDTGQGIKPEDQEKLFSSFMQVDTTRNRGIEGTGLGLAITKQLCLAMGGDINISSEYGKGSTFTVIIPQEIVSHTPFAEVENAGSRKVLIYERRLVYAQSLSWTLKNLGVPYVMAASLEDFAEALAREEWYFVFSGYGLYERIKPIMDKAVYPNGKPPPVALMVEWGTEAYVPNVRFVSLPVQSLSIANTLNCKNDRPDYLNGSRAMNEDRFTIPTARLLVVDDLATNLKVAEGLLAPYGAVVETCLSGAEAIELIKSRAGSGEGYDLVFMDHMMPEMDGIEATAAIRAWEQGRSEVPIIALTANAVSGMREMFLEKGFNDFLAKPIDVSKLYESLDRWIPKEKREVKIENGELRIKKKLILLVDNNLANLKQSKNILEEIYDVITAPSAEKMFTILENDRPALIVMNAALHNSGDPPVINEIPVVIIEDPSTLITCVENYFKGGNT